MRVDISGPALRFVQRRGGDLYVWFTDLGDRSLLAHVGTTRPADREFIRQELPAGARLWLEAADLPEPSEIRIRRRPWPVGPIEATWVGGPGGELAPANITPGDGGL